MENHVSKFINKMVKENLPEIVMETFEYYYNKLLEGETGLLPETEIIPVEHLHEYEKLDDKYLQLGQSLIDKSVIIKLNGGLGTSMGLSEAKSLLKIKGEETFLDIIAQQAELNKLRLVLMNSFNTQKKSLELLDNYPNLKNDLPLDFLQHKIPKIDAESYEPATYELNESLEWCPPGHGEIYTALVTSGMLRKLMRKGIRYAFISNSDNLGAVLDKKILGFFADNKFPFLMEVADRTESDKKGGHLAKLLNGQLVLRESAQCPKQEMASFQDVEKYKYFNTNNIWIDLVELEKTMAANKNILGLPMIVNKKNVNPKDPNSKEVFQLETAMGSAISVFINSSALSVPRSRFAPVKTTDDLLGVRSDNYILTDDYRVIENPKRKLDPLVVSLDREFYKMVDDLDARIPSAPSLVNCNSLKIIGDFKIGQNVKFIGDVSLKNENTAQKIITDNAVIGE